MIKHKRRPDYWVYYHLGHCTETVFLIDMITNLVRENPCPHQEKSNRGGMHSRVKLDFTCILMAAWHKISRGMESYLSVIRIPWAGEPASPRQSSRPITSPGSLRSALDGTTPNAS